MSGTSRLASLAILAISVFVTGTSHAQSETRPELAADSSSALFGMIGGITFPANPFYNGSGGWDAGVAYEKMLARRPGAIELGDQQFDGNAATAISLRLHERFMDEKRDRPATYLMVGFGVWRLNTPSGVVGTVGLDLGAGIRSPVDRNHSAGSEALYERLGMDGPSSFLVRLSLLTDVRSRH